MRLAADEITLRFGNGAPLFLKPTLRCSVRLESRHGLPALHRGITEGSITVITDIIREGADLPTWAFPVENVSLVGAPAFKAALLGFVLSLYGLDEDAPADAGPEAARITFAEAYAALFRVATGWLRWPPEVALNATRHEINEAFDGLLESRGVNRNPAASLDDKVGAMMRKLDADDRAEAIAKDRERRRAKVRGKKAA